MAQHPKAELGQGATVKQANGEVKSGDQAAREAQMKKDEMKVSSRSLHSPLCRAAFRASIG